MSITLSQHQLDIVSQTVDALNLDSYTHTLAVLTGVAGSGKTSCIASIMDIIANKHGNARKVYLDTIFEIAYKNLSLIIEDSSIMITPFEENNGWLAVINFSWPLFTLYDGFIPNNL